MSERQLATRMHEGLKNVAWTYDRIDAADLDALAQANLGTRQVWLAGYNINRYFAYYVYWQLVKAVPDAAVILQAGLSLSEHFAAMGADDLVIWIALHRAKRIRTKGMVLLSSNVATNAAIFPGRLVRR